MNKSLVLLAATLFVANAHADILNTQIHYPAYPEYKYYSVEYLNAANNIKDSSLRKAIIDKYNQQTASAQLTNKLVVVAFSTALTGFVTAGFTALMEWYQNFRIRRARASKEVARIEAEKALARVATQARIQQAKAYIAQTA